MELLNLPFTGPTSLLYDPPKELMKYVAYTEGINTPAYALIENTIDIEKECKHLRYPLFVKPSKAGDSLGIDSKSLVNNVAELKEKTEQIIDEYAPLLVEEYVNGREFTVMLVAGVGDKKEVKIFKPIEYIFPYDVSFKTYDLKTSSLHPLSNIPCNDTTLAEKLQQAVLQIFTGFGAVGYARLDLSLNDKNEIYFLEMSIANPTLDDLQRFMAAPRGCETTGGKFTPDGKTFFVSIQHPDKNNTPPFDKTVVIAVYFSKFAL